MLNWFGWFWWRKSRAKRDESRADIERTLLAEREKARGANYALERDLAQLKSEAKDRGGSPAPKP